MSRFLVIQLSLFCCFMNSGCLLPYDIMAIEETLKPAPDDTAYKREQVLRKEISSQRYEVKLTFDIKGKVIEVKRNYNCGSIYDRKANRPINTIDAKIFSNKTLVLSYDEMASLCYKLYKNRIFSIAKHRPSEEMLDLGLRQKIEPYVFVIDNAIFPGVMQYYGRDLDALKKNLSIDLIDVEFTLIRGESKQDIDKLNWIFQTLRTDDRGIEYKSYFLIKANYSEELAKILKDNVKGNKPVQLDKSQTLEWLYKSFKLNSTHQILQELKLNPRFDSDYFRIIDKNKVTHSTNLNLAIHSDNMLMYTPAEPIIFYKHKSNQYLHDFIIQLPSGGILKNFREHDNEIESLIYDPADNQLYRLFILRRKINPFENLK